MNAARVSFHKHKEKFEDSDEKLLMYLATHNHWTPFSHPQITVRVKVPIFVARQLFKHKIGMTENEISRRYVDDDPEFYLPSTWRGRPTGGAKQGSSNESIGSMLFHGTVESWEGETEGFYYSHIEANRALYNSMIKAGIAPEMARMVLPQSMYTEWYWTGSLSAFARIYKLRSDPHAQKESQDVAAMLGDIISPLFPVSWKALTVDIKS